MLTHRKAIFTSALDKMVRANQSCRILNFESNFEELVPHIEQRFLPSMVLLFYGPRCLRKQDDTVGYWECLHMH